MSSRKPLLMIMYGKFVGGAELQFIELARELAKRHDIRLISLGGDGAVKSFGIPEEIELKVYPYDGKFSASLALSLAWMDNFRYKAKAVVSTSVIGNILAFSLKYFGDKRLVSLQTVSKAMRYPTVDRFVLRHYDTLIAGSSDIKAYLLGHGQRAESIEVINNWVDFSKRKVTAERVTTRKRFGIGEKDVVLGCVGRLHHQKGQEFLIKAFRELKQRYSGLRLVLVGDGPSAEMLRDEAHDLGESVVFTGLVVGDDYNNLIDAFDIYVQPSRFEGLPRTLLDAMYLGKPIVATNVNGNSEALHDGVNGLLVHAESAGEIIAAVCQLLDNPQLAFKLGRQAHKDALSSFDMVRQLQCIESTLG